MRFLVLCLALALAPLLSYASPGGTPTSGASMVSTGTASAIVETSADVSPVPQDLPRLKPLDLDDIVARGYLVVGMVNVDNPPFYMERNGELVGYDIEMMRSFASLLEVELRFNRDATSFNQVVDFVEKGIIDIGASKLSRSFSRGIKVAFTRPYLEVHHGLLLNRVEFAKLAKGRPAQEVIQDFTGSMGIIQKSSFVEFARRNFPRAKPIEYPEWADVLKAVNAGEVTSVYRDELEIKKVLRENPASELTLRTVSLRDTRDSIALAVNHSNPTLLNQLNLFLETNVPTLSADDILDRYESVLFPKK